MESEKELLKLEISALNALYEEAGVEVERLKTRNIGQTPEYWTAVMKKVRIYNVRETKKIRKKKDEIRDVS